MTRSIDSIGRLKASILNGDKGIQKARKPKGTEYIAGVALVLEGGGARPVNIKVTKELEDRIAMIMPYGIGPENKVYFKVIKFGSKYQLWVCYIDDQKRVKVGEYLTKPKWIGR